MAFNKDAYVADFIKPRRRAGSLRDDDIVERYALTLPATDADISAVVRAVRAYWNGQRPGTAAAAICKLCITEDERLQKQHGGAMLTAAWWQQRATAARKAGAARTGEMAEHLKNAYGQLGVVTRSVVDNFALKFGVQPADGVTAAKQAGLSVVHGVELPESPPISAPQFKELCLDLGACGARTIPALLHPTSGTFTILERYACGDRPELRLDALAVRKQLAEADKRGTSAADTSLRRALNALNSADQSGASLDRLTLHHLVTVASQYVSLGMGVTQTELSKLGLDRTEAAVLAVILAEHNTAAGAVGIARVERLLSEGKLNEAQQAAHSLPAESENHAQAIRLVQAARARLDDLLLRAGQALAVPDELKAASLIREAAAISIEDAEQALNAVPLVPPSGLQIAGDGESVKLYWQPGTGHSDGTTYLVARSETGAPPTPADGRQLGRQTETSFNDAHSAVARTVHYSVFAATTGRPSSRPASASIMLLPPVSNLVAEVGPNEVTLHWSTHPSAHEVEVMRTAPGSAPVPVPLRGNSCGLAGLPEGQSLHFEVTALYRGPDGRVLRAAPEHVNATPRSEAKPIAKLRARPIDVSGEVRVRVSWTPVDNSEVRVMRSSTPSPWTSGTWVSPEEVSRFGTEITGRRVTGRSELAIEAELPPGVHHLVPFSSGGTGTVVGHPAIVGVTNPVTRLKATRFASSATLSWEWPASSQLAEVTWDVDGNQDVMVIGKAEYQSKGGATIPLGRTTCSVEVRTMIQAQGRSFPSPPAALVIDTVSDVQIGYSISTSPSIGKFGGRSKKVTFVSTEGCRDVRVQVIASPGLVLPGSAGQGYPLLNVMLDLAPGVPVTHPVTVPRNVSRPYWVRGFVLGGRGRLVDPPITQLKET